MKRLRAVVLFLLLCLLLVAVYAWQIEPRMLGVTRIALPDKLAEALGGRRVVYLADLHVASTWPIRERLLATLRALDPDILLVGGDLVWYQKDLGPAIDVLKQLPSREGTFSVLGDSDYMGRIRNCAYCHVPGSRELRTDVPVTFLRDEAVDLAGGAVQLVGLDGDRRRHWGKVYRELSDPETPTMVLVHYPEALRDIAPLGADLVLAGDTHGGQILAPDFLLAWRYGEDRVRYRYGWFRDHDTPMFVTRGVGESGVPLRLGRKPEVVVLEDRR